MSRKIARITQEKKLLLDNEVVEDSTKIRLDSDGRLDTDEIIEYPAELEGGRNLLSNNDIVAGWSSNIFNEVSSYHYTTNVQSTIGAFIYQRFDLDGNHIFQIQVKTNDENLLGKTIIWQSGGRNVSEKSIILSEDWQTLISVPIEGENVPVGLRIVEGTSGELLSRYLKLEKGSQATPWTPAPEDLGLNYPDSIQNFNSSISGNNIIIPEFIECYPFVKPVIDDSLILWLDGTTGNNYDKTGTWKDLSGNGNDGELVNFGYTEDSGWGNGGLKFDGVNDYVETKEAYIDFPLSYEVCFKYHEIRNYNSAISTYRYGDGNSYRKGFRLHPLRGNLCVTFGDMTTNKNVIIKQNIELNKIYHVVIVFKEDFTQFKALVNGELSTHDISIWHFPDEKKIRWGCSGVDHAAYYSNITVYRSRVYNRALTDEEILQNYRAGQCSPLLAMRGDIIG